MLKKRFPLTPELAAKDRVFIALLMIESCGQGKGIQITVLKSKPHSTRFGIVFQPNPRGRPHLPRISPLIPALTRICCAPATWLIAVPRS
jgi:hypothetical protein